ncbi:MAG TPA: hypothetical protein VGG59_13280 [Acidobacteriaceae bacterium]
MFMAEEWWILGTTVPAEYRMILQNWNAVEREIDNIVALSDETFDRATLANVRDLLIHCKAYSQVPNGAGKGYWNTIILWWSNFEIEICDNRFELYRFEGQETKIWYSDHVPGTPLSSGLIDDLRRYTLP